MLLMNSWWQTDTQLGDEAIPRAFPLFGSIGWDNPLPYLPESIHTAVNGSTMIESLFVLWENHAQTLWGMDGAVEELLLISGQLICDIQMGQFAQQDAEDPWPKHLPWYLSHTNFSMATQDRMSTVCLAIWNSICYTAQMELFGQMQIGPDVLGSSRQTPSGSGARVILGMDDIQAPLETVSDTSILPSTPFHAQEPAPAAPLGTSASSHTLGHLPSAAPVVTSIPPSGVPVEINKKGKQIKPRQPPRKKSKKPYPDTPIIPDTDTRCE